jgi:hypothetical protein
MNEQKLCKDCKYYKKDWVSHLFPIFGYRGEFDTCQRLVNPVTGRKQVDFCSIERRYYYPFPTCGPEAKYFEPKNS